MNSSGTQNPPTIVDGHTGREVEVGEAVGLEVGEGVGAPVGVAVLPARWHKTLSLGQGGRCITEDMNEG